MSPSVNFACSCDLLSLGECSLAQRTRAGLPYGAQAIGPYLEDRTTIAFSGLVEREFGGFVAPPGY